MNLSTLKNLMKQRKIKSYFQLAREVEIPYTTLLDVVHGKSKNSYLIKTLADYFGIKSTILLEKLEPYQIILEDGRRKRFLYTKPLEEQNALVRLLLQENFD